MKVAIIGAGISGLTAAYRLSTAHDVTVFEAEDDLGGHTNTVDVELDGERHAIDTGFIVFNDWTYPNFIALLNELDVTSVPTSMSFSVRCDAANLEYTMDRRSTDCSPQCGNLIRPSFNRMLRDILRFNKVASEVLRTPVFSEATVGEIRETDIHVSSQTLPAADGFGDLVMSSGNVRIVSPSGSSVDFDKNHGLLSVAE